MCVCVCVCCRHIFLSLLDIGSSPLPDIVSLKSRWKRYISFIGSSQKDTFPPSAFGVGSAATCSALAHMVLTRSQSRAARSAAQAARYAARRRARYASGRLTPSQREARNSANAASMRRARAALSDDARAAQNAANAAAMRRARCIFRGSVPPSDEFNSRCALRTP